MDMEENEAKTGNNDISILANHDEIAINALKIEKNVAKLNALSGVYQHLTRRFSFLGLLICQTLINFRCKNVK